MENRSHAMAAGAFVLALLALLVGLAVWLTRDRATYETYELSTKDAISGLQPQAAVRYKGVAVGKVTYIGFDKDSGAEGNVLIQIDVAESAPLSSATFATLAYQGVTGLAYVQLDDAPQPLPTVPPGSDGIPRLQLQTSQLGKLTEQAPEILAQVKEAGERLNALLADENQKRFADALTNIGKAASDISVMVNRVDQTISTRLDPALAGIPPMTREATNTLRSLQGTSDEIAKTARRLNAEGGPIDKLAEGTSALAHAADSFGAATLPRVNRVTEDASRAARQLSRTVNGINDNPQSLIFGNGPVQPGPGEAGFAAPAAAPRTGVQP